MDDDALSDWNLSKLFVNKINVNSFCISKLYFHVLVLREMFCSSPGCPC